jgi:hypothetical protein
MIRSAASAPDAPAAASALAEAFSLCTASPRFTAVGRLVNRWSSLPATNAHTSAEVLKPAFDASRSTASASAAAIAIAGAPRTFISRIMVQHASQSATSMNTVSPGSFSWSSSCSEPRA